MPQIHVIIPVYNAKKFLRQAVDSVLNQPYKGIDIVLVNDGSTDGSAELCDEIAAKEERVCVIHQANQGVSIARNAGIELVLKNGTDKDYIAFLDADDKWAVNFWDERNLALLKKGYTVVGFQSCRCNYSTTRRQIPTLLNSGMYQGGENTVWVHASQTFGAMLYSLKHLHNYDIRFIDGLKTNEDRIFTMQCLYLADSIFLENRILYLYRNNPLSASHKKRNAIDKYVPMIEAYMKSDKKMEQWKINGRGSLCQGHVMAAIYVVDMIEEHYQQFGTKREVDEMLAKKPEYSAILESSTVWKAKHTVERWEALTAHPLRYQLHCYLRGIIFMIKHGLYMFLYKNRYIAAIIDKKRYPVMIEK
ncbi:MAG: glycosyltransferase family 2 protein [Oscillospiraceae bacterium]|nr:glycosyltransferase family 2 protein [Oscillospiraceae bacterium]